MKIKLFGWALLMILLSSTAIGQVKYELTNNDQESIVYAFEESRFASEIYGSMFAKWEEDIFSKLQKIKKYHFSMMQKVAQKYGVTTPNVEYGVYNDPELQDLYLQTMTNNAFDYTSALTSAGEIEERIIVDLMKFFGRTDNADLIITYDALINGAKKHLNLVVVELRNFGIEYEPQMLSMDKYLEIVPREAN